MEKKPKVIVILGPTSSGKTKMGVDLAYRNNGEIVSADSRQVFKGMDVGTGKDLDEYVVKGKNIPYHLIDVVSPNTEFHLSRYKELAEEAIDDILRRNKVPIIVGGTGLYLQSVIDNFGLSSVKPDKELRDRLEELTAEELFSELQGVNKVFANKLNNSERGNKRRLIRYIEITKQGIDNVIKKKNKRFDSLVIGIETSKDVLWKRIKSRLIEMVGREEMIEEVRGLRKKGVTWKRLDDFGLEYRYAARYLQGKLELDEMIEKLNIAIRQYSKKQKSWFKRWEKQGQKIHWVKDIKEANNLVDKFIK